MSSFFLLGEALATPWEGRETSCKASPLALRHFCQHLRIFSAALSHLSCWLPADAYLSVEVAPGPGGMLRGFAVCSWCWVSPPCPNPPLRLVSHPSRRCQGCI